MTDNTTGAQAQAPVPASVPTSESVRATTSVDIAQAQAFELFTRNYATWAPKDQHIGPTDVQRVVMEPRVGGRWYEVGADQSEWDWGRVVAWEPAGRVVLTWQLSEQWQFDPDPSKASELEVRFIAESPTRTRIELEHRGFDRRGPGGIAIREMVASPYGWSGNLALYAAAAAAR